jgi:hypothetical protein
MPRISLWTRLFGKAVAAKSFVWSPAVNKSAATNVALMSFQSH